MIEAIFYKGVVVCEADADRAIYQSVASKEFNNQNILFVHSHNKQTLKDVVKALREANVPTAAIADIDLLDDRNNFNSLIETLTTKNIKSELENNRKNIADSVNKIPESEILKEIQKQVSEFLVQLKQTEHTLDGARGALNRLRKKASNWSLIKETGIEGFSKEIKETAIALLNKLKEYNLFIVPVGELESWMDLSTDRKKEWVISALTEIYNGKVSSKLREFIKEILQKLGENVI